MAKRMVEPEAFPRCARECVAVLHMCHANGVQVHGALLRLFIDVLRIVVVIDGVRMGADIRTIDYDHETLVEIWHRFSGVWNGTSPDEEMSYDSRRRVLSESAVAKEGGIMFSQEENDESEPDMEAMSMSKKTSKACEDCIFWGSKQCATKNNNEPACEFFVSKRTQPADVSKVDRRPPALFGVTLNTYGPRGQA